MGKLQHSPLDRNLALTLIAVGYELYKSTLIGNAPRDTHDRHVRMTNPCIGDLVMETSSGAWAFRSNYRTPPESAVGILKSIAEELIPFDEPWNEAAEGKPQPTEKIFYVIRLDVGEVVRWTNAEFVTIIPVEGWGTTIKHPCLRNAFDEIYETLPTAGQTAQWGAS